MNASVPPVVQTVEDDMSGENQAKTRKERVQELRRSIENAAQHPEIKRLLEEDQKGEQVSAALLELRLSST
jgi:hypothetical protein